MAKHDVRVELSTKVVQKKDVKFGIKSNGVKLGSLLVSQGNIEWVPSGNSKNKWRMSWEKLDLFMQVHIPANVNTQSGHREHLSLPTHHEAGF
jgi:hypothetical protein